MIAPPPSSTPFPYRPPFRSLCAPVPRRGCRGSPRVPVPADSLRPLPTDQRRGADQRAGAVGRAHAPAIRQAAREPAAGVDRRADRDVAAVLQLAVGARLDGGPAARTRGRVRRARPAGRMATLEGRPAHRARDDDADDHLHAALDLLPELQVRLLATPRSGATAARGA